MNDDMNFNDPAFVARVQGWAADRRALDRAPGRLVDAVMDGVTASPRRKPWFARLPLRGVAGYAALTAAITVGVTFGILLAGRLTPDAGEGSPSPPITAPVSGAPSTPATSDAPSSGPSSGPPASPSVLARLADVPIAATAIGASGDSVWVADRDDRLAELDPVTGTVVRSVSLPRSASALLVTADAVWVSSTSGDLVRIARLDLAIAEVPGAIGGALAVGDGVIWLGGENEIVRVSLETNVVELRVPVANRGPELGLVELDGALWVATRTEILRLDGGTGEATGRIQGDASAVLVIDGALWATRGTELLRIDTTAVAVAEFIPGMRSSGPVAFRDGVLWFGGGSGPSVIEGLELASREPRHVAEVPAGAASMAITSDSIWVASGEAEVVYRFRLP